MGNETVRLPTLSKSPDKRPVRLDLAVILRRPDVIVVATISSVLAEKLLGPYGEDGHSCLWAKRVAWLSPTTWSRSRVS